MNINSGDIFQAKTYISKDISAYFKMNSLGLSAIIEGIFKEVS